MIVRPNIRSAFTLVELMVVITIIAVIAGVMAIEMRGTYEDALLRANARKLIDVCDAASNRAIAIRQAQVLRINATSGKFIVEPKLLLESQHVAFAPEHISSNIEKFCVDAISF